MMKNKTYKKITAAVIAAILIPACAVFTAEFMKERFMPGTYVNGIDVSWMPADRAEEMLEEIYAEDYALDIYGNNKTACTLKAEDAGISYAFDLTEAKDKSAGILNLFNGSGYDLQPAISYNEETLSRSIDEMPFFAPENITEPADAYIYDTGTSFLIMCETEGSTPILDRIRNSVENAVAEQSRILILDRACYVQAEITEDDKELNDIVSSLNRITEASVAYDISGERYVIDDSVFHGWITWDGDEAGLDRDGVLSWVTDLARETDTSYTTRTFRVGDKDVEVSGPYGFRIDREAETDELINLIMNGTVTEREPVYSIRAYSRDDELGDTFVEVDLTNQKVTLYSEGEAIITTDCVTGNTSNGNGTPDGIYPVSYKQRNAVLRGQRRADGSYEYESPVNYWMPFNGGIGLHDATWRGSFGGKIYKTNGSHGCVNLPLSAAKTIYEYVYAGMPVICHY